MLEQFRRVARGKAPASTGTNTTSEASRALSHVEMEDLVRRAHEIYPGNGATNIVFTSRVDRVLGDGIAQNGAAYETYTSYVVRFDSNGWVTAFPARADWSAGGPPAPFEFRLFID